MPVCRDGEGGRRPELRARAVSSPAPPRGGDVRAGDGWLLRLLRERRKKTLLTRNSCSWTFVWVSTQGGSPKQGSAAGVCTGSPPPRPPRPLMGAWPLYSLQSAVLLSHPECAAAICCEIPLASHAGSGQLGRFLKRLSLPRGLDASWQQATPVWAHPCARRVALSAVWGWSLVRAVPWGRCGHRRMQCFHTSLCVVAPSEVAQPLRAHPLFSGAVRLPARAPLLLQRTCRACASPCASAGTEHTRVWGRPSWRPGFCALCYPASRFQGSVTLARWRSLPVTAAPHAPPPSHCQASDVLDHPMCAARGRTLSALLVAAAAATLFLEGRRALGCGKSSVTVFKTLSV